MAIKWVDCYTVAMGHSYPLPSNGGVARPNLLKLAPSNGTKLVHYVPSKNGVLCPQYEKKCGHRFCNCELKTIQW